MRIKRLAAGLAIWAAAWAIASAEEVRIDGPAGPLGGAYLAAEGARQIVVIVPGSGPTNRDGNSPGPLQTDAYKLLAEGLATSGIASIRVDKRGMFSSASDGIDPNNVTVAGYAADIRAWSASASAKMGVECAWVLGHSEGGLMALAAAQTPGPICGLVLVAAPGRPLGVLLREQLQANPANRGILKGALRAIDALEAGEYAEFAIYEFTLKRLFPRGVQDYLIDLFAHDPAVLIKVVDLPVLIVQGTRDLQVTEVDANALKSARPAAELAIIADLNHVLKRVLQPDRAANARTYGDPSLPLHPELLPVVTRFMQMHDK